ALLFEGFFDGLNLVANLGRRFKLQRLRFLCHLLPQYRWQFVLLDLDKQDGLPDSLPVIRLAYGQDAGCQATFDLILETGPAAVFKVVFGAIAQKKMLLKDVQRAPSRHCRRKRPKITVAVLDDLTRREDSRPGVLCRNFNAQIALVVFKSNIVARLVLLDEIVFENQRFFVITRDQSLDIGDASHEKLDLAASIRTMKIGSHTGAKNFGLCDVDDFSSVVPH